MTRDLYERYGRQIYAYCLHQLGSREEAEDATQTTFMNAFRGLQRGIVPELESAWLYKIASNVVLTRRRSSYRRRRVETPGDLDALQDLLPSPQRDVDELVRLDEALRGLPEQQRRALLLREWQGLSYREIADELELSQGAVETLLFRARRSLAAALTEPEAERPRRKALSRLRSGLDLGSVLAAAKALLSGGAAVKVAVTAAAVATTAVGAGTEMARHHLKPEPKAPRVAAASARVPEVPRAHAPAPTPAPPVRHVTAAARKVVHRSAPKPAPVEPATPVVSPSVAAPTTSVEPPVVVTTEPVVTTTTAAPTPVVPATSAPEPPAPTVAVATTTAPAPAPQAAPGDHGRRSEASVKEVVEAVVAKLRDARSDAPAPVTAPPPTVVTPQPTTSTPVEVPPAPEERDGDREHGLLGLLHRR
jgi:RNA polymerase sigma factor (sigma-70 family)